MTRFDGKTAIVTGAGSGIGRAMAIRLAAEGARLVLVDVDEAVNETARAASPSEDTVATIVGDASSPAVVDEAVATAERFGTCDLAFANAGISGGLTPLADLGVEEWERVLRINLIGAFLLVQGAARAMVARGRGAIVCTASVAGIRATAGGIAYSASKAGVISLVQTSANALAGTGVRVNAICPGLTETGMTQSMFDRARARGNEAKLGQLNPLRRAALPDEPAAVALWLASDDASYVNGQAVAVDGGLTSTHPFVPGRMS